MKTGILSAALLLVGSYVLTYDAHAGTTTCNTNGSTTVCSSYNENTNNYDNQVILNQQVGKPLSGLDSYNDNRSDD
jgi:hypothetical protein